MQQEAWAAIADAPLYEVSSWGRVRRRNNDDDYFDVATWENHKGYVMVSIEIDGQPQLRYVHLLVLYAFAGINRARRIANHLNGVKSDNALENLEWTTPSGNVIHGRRLRAELLYGQESLLELFG